MISPELSTISGIGEKTTKKLLKDFRSVKNIKEADKSKLTKSVGQAKATIVFNHFHSNK
jgi:excinuclease ABC subunit C